MDAMKKPVINIEKLKVIFKCAKGYIRAVENVDITVNEGESVAIVGESGCGKSVTVMALMRLLRMPPARYTAETMTLWRRDGRLTDLTAASEKEMLSIRGNEMSMIFQDPSAALNPVLTIGEQLDEVFVQHRRLNRRQARAASIGALKSVGIPAPQERCRQFPHELSGGMKQRILIAMATACSPRLMIADEPTTALDVTVQAQILKLISDLRKTMGMSLLLITHDFGVVREAAERVYVMYCGKIVEQGTVAEVLDNPLHPYTKGLLDTIPAIDSEIEEFVQIPGNVPHPSEKGDGCYFADRCKYCMDICRRKMPRLKDCGGRTVRCWLKDDDHGN